MMWLRKNFFSIITVAVFALVISISYVRFMVLHDYVVAYEGDCDQYIQSCFVGSDEDTGEEYYYSKIQKYAPNIEAQCGPDITDCGKAQECLPEDGGRCSITYCDSVNDEDTCETFTEDDRINDTSDGGGSSVVEDVPEGQAIGDMATTSEKEDSPSTTTNEINI